MSVMTPPSSLYDYSRRELAELLAGWGESPVHAGRIWGQIYRQGVTKLDELTALPARLREKLAERATLPGLTLTRETHSSDGQTRKYLLTLADGRQIETVLMRFHGRMTACLSSQAGCALGCVFCATGQQGFSRNLTAGEIVAQALFVQRKLRLVDPFPGGWGQAQRDAGAPSLKNVQPEPPTPPRLRNLVLMGMGEPLLNYGPLMTALDILRDSAGLAIGGKQITISTVGVVPGIVRLADEERPYSLAVSLHAATQAERAAIVPAAITWPLDELLAACRYYTTRLNRRIFFEWTLIEDANDSPEQARALAELLQGLPAQVNLIPLNPTSGYGGLPGRPDSARQFQAVLQAHGLPATVRQRRGIDIAAGCGQLAGG